MSNLELKLIRKNSVEKIVVKQFVSRRFRDFDYLGDRKKSFILPHQNRIVHLPRRQYMRVLRAVK